MADTNISERHRRAFEALTSGAHQNFALFSCLVDGEPAAAIVAVNTTRPPGTTESPSSSFLLCLSASSRA